MKYSHLIYLVSYICKLFSCSENYVHTIYLKTFVFDCHKVTMAMKIKPTNHRTLERNLWKVRSDCYQVEFRINFIWQYY